MGSKSTGRERRGKKRLTGKMTVWCCICGRTLGTKPCKPEFDGQTSSTYCDQCNAVELAKLEEYYRKMGMGTESGHDEEERVYAH